VFSNKVRENKIAPLCKNKEAAIQFLNTEKKQYLGSLSRSPSKELIAWIESSLKTIVTLLNIMHGLMPPDKDALLLAKEIDRSDFGYPIIKTLLDLGLPKELLNIIIWEKTDKALLKDYFPAD
jgi:hypothetical protein